ncbi:hypothetical protein JCM8208_002945 [Rhodotorula glutinis]
MGRRSRHRDLSDSPSSSSEPSASDDDSPASSDSNISSRHARSTRRHETADSSSDDGASTGSSEAADDRRRRHPRGGGSRRRRGRDSSDDSSDEEALIPAHHHRDRRRRRATADSPQPVAGYNKLLVGGAILIVLLALGGGAWWWFNRDSAGSASSSSSDGSSAGSEGGTAAGSTGSTVAGTSGAGASGGGDGEAGSAGGGASKGSSASGGGGSAAGASKTASAGSSAAAAPSGSSASGNSSSSGATGGGSGGSGKVAAFWENWTGLSVADTDFSGYDYCFWFCAVPGTAAEKGKLTMGEATDGVAKDWVKASQAAGCKAMLSIGGWSGSNTFSGLVATDTSRADFVDTLDTAMNDYGFDGIDADWEYPAKAGATEDFDTPNDLKNYLEFFKALRAKIGSDKLISSDTSSGPWVGADGSPSKDLSEFGNVLDFITVMTYDAVTYSAAATGRTLCGLPRPSSPDDVGVLTSPVVQALDSSCAPSTQQFSYPAAVKSWTDAKFPANKIMLGLASYGYAWKVDDFKDGGGVDGASSSIYQKASGTLSASDGSKPYDTIISDFKKDMDYTFDDCSKTPFLYSSSSQLLITYDDADSFAVKGAVAGEGGLMGCSLYAALTQNTDGTLRDAAKKVC